MTEWMSYSKTHLMWELKRLGEGYSFEVRTGRENPWDFEMRLLEKSWPSGSGLGSNWDEYIFEAVYQNSRVYIQYKEGKFQIALDPTSSLRITPDFEIVGRFLPKKKSAQKKGIKSDQKNSGLFFYRFGDVLTVDAPGLALYLYGEVNSYTIGQAYAWNNQNEYVLAGTEEGFEVFYLEDFVAAGRHYNMKGAPQGVAFYHRGKGLLNGLKEMHNAFPEATTKDIRALCAKFDIPPSSQIGRFFPKEEPVTQRPARKKVNSNKVSSELDELIEDYNIRPYGKKQLMMNTPSLGQDMEMVVKNRTELLNQVRAEGGVITRTQAGNIWEQLVGGE